MKQSRSNTLDKKAENAQADTRFPMLLALLAALILIAFFVYPAGAYPRQALLLSGIELSAAAILAGWLVFGSSAFRRYCAPPEGGTPVYQPPASGLFLPAIGSVPALGCLCFVVWAVARWRFAEVPELEREWVVGLLALAVGLVLGIGVAVVCRSLPPEATSRTHSGPTSRTHGEPTSRTPGEPASRTHGGPASRTPGEPTSRTHGEPATAGLIPLTPGGSDLRTFFRLAAVGAIGFGVYAFYQYFISYPANLNELVSQAGGAIRDLNTQSLIHAFRERRVGGTLGNPNLFAAQLSVFALLSLAAARGPGRFWRILGWAGAVLSLAAVLLSRSRGGALTMALALGLGGLMLIGRPRAEKNNSAFRIPHSALWMLAGIALFRAGQAMAAHEGLMQRLANISTIRERLFYWSIALKVWARHPWIGEGPGGYQLLYLTLKSPVARESQFAHSWFFQTGSELGIIGVGLLLVFFGGALGRVWAAWRRGGLHPDAPWCLGALMVLAVNGLFEFSLQWHAFLTAAGLLGGLVCGLTSSGVPPSGGIHSAIRIPYSAFLGLALAVMIGILALAISPPYYFAQQAQWDAELAGRDEPPRWSDAVKDYGRAVRWLPASPGLRLDWAGALEQVGLDGEAWNQMNEAQRLNPRSAAVRAAQAGWLARRSRPAEALAKMSEAIERYPSHVGYRLERARLALAAGQAAPARADLEFIEKNRLPVWEYQQPDYLKLRARAGLPPVSDIPS